MARPSCPSTPFRTELPASPIIRRLAREGAATEEAARALYQEAVRRLCPPDAPVPEAPEPVAALARNALALFPVTLAEGTPGALTPEWLEDFHRLSQPEADLKRHGRWYTARPIARYMARRALAHRPSPALPHAALDPACGCGALLVPLLETVVERARASQPARNAREIVEAALSGLTGVDVDAGALETARLRLRWAAERLAGGPVEAEPRLLHGDALSMDLGALAGGGVDIVVMNPPYLGNRYFNALPNPPAARAALRKAFGWNDDLYTHFLHRAWDWLGPDGVLCALTSDTFLAIPSKARTRHVLRQHALREIVRVPPSAFAASVHTCITVACRRAPEPDAALSYTDARTAPEAAWDALENEPAPSGVERFRAPARAYANPEAPFFRPTPRALALFRRYWPGDEEPDGMALVALGDVAPARDCGINSGNVRHRLFFADHRPGLSRLIQGRQLERYVVRWDAPCAQYRWVDVGYRPDPSVRGLGRGGRPSALGEAWGFRGDLALHLAPERLLLRQTEDDLFAAYLGQDPDDPVYTDNTLFTLLLNDDGEALGLSCLYLLGLLNSAFLNELYHAVSQEEGRAQAQVKVGYVNRLPIVVPTDEQRHEMEQCVRAAMDARGRSGAAAIQWRIDAMVEDLYDVHGLPPR